MMMVFFRAWNRESLFLGFSANFSRILEFYIATCVWFAPDIFLVHISFRSTTRALSRGRPTFRVRISPSAKLTRSASMCMTASDWNIRKHSACQCCAADSLFIRAVADCWANARLTRHTMAQCVSHRRQKASSKHRDDASSDNAARYSVSALDANVFKRFAADVWA